MLLTAGDKLGPYEIVAPLGAGGMGQVWTARDTRLDRLVAIKQLTDRHDARFEQEPRAVAALNHPNICQIFDIGPDYLVMEYVEGKPLSNERDHLCYDERRQSSYEIFEGREPPRPWQNQSKKAQRDPLEINRLEP